MSWLRIDDGFAEHPKVQACSERARWLHVVALCYCARNLTDGFLDRRAVKVVCAIVDRPCRSAIGELVAAGLWIDLEDGFQIKDYLEWNPDAETVKKKRRERQEAGRRGGLAKAKANAVANAVADAFSSQLVPPPLPSHEDLNPIGALKQLLELFDEDGQEKIRRTANANRCGPAAIRLALEAARHGSARDPLAVALSTLKKRRAA